MMALKNAETKKATGLPPAKSQEVLLGMIVKSIIWSAGVISALGGFCFFILWVTVWEMKKVVVTDHSRIVYTEIVVEKLAKKSGLDLSELKRQRDDRIAITQ